MQESNFDNHYFKMLEKVMDNKANDNKWKEITEGENEISLEKLEKLMEEAKEEVSELEFNVQNKSVYKFVSPPSTQKDYLKTLAEVDTRYEMSKHFLDGKTSKNFEKNSVEKKLTEKDLLNRTPPNFLISNLEYPKTKSDIILCGVEKRSYIHASMLSDLLIKYNPSLVYVQISPDEPFFIRKHNDYDQKLKEKKEKYGELSQYLDENLNGFKAFWKSFIKDK